MNAFMKIIVFFVLMSATSAQMIRGQDIEMYNFNEFEPLLHKNNDTTYVVNFWATWCIPCRKELPEFEKIHKDYEDSNVEVLLVSLDFPTQVESNLIPFIEKNNITAEVVLLNDPNSNAWIDKVDAGWSGALPATVIYKNNSKFFFEEELDYNSILNTINKLNGN